MDLHRSSLTRADAEWCAGYKVNEQGAYRKNVPDCKTAKGVTEPADKKREQKARILIGNSRVWNLRSGQQGVQGRKSENVKIESTCLDTQPGA